MVQQPATGFLSCNLGQSVFGATPSTFEGALNGEVLKPLKKKVFKKCLSWKTWAVHYEEIMITVLLICAGRGIYINLREPASIYLVHYQIYKNS